MISAVINIVMPMKQVHWYLLVDFKKMFKFFLLFFSGCHSSSGHPLGMEGIMADPTRDQSSGNESVNM